jgi:hypothetical protein
MIGFNILIVFIIGVVITLYKGLITVNQKLIQSWL